MSESVISSHEPPVLTCSVHNYTLFGHKMLQKNLPNMIVFVEFVSSSVTLSSTHDISVFT